MKTRQAKKGKAIGIDLGTSNSAAAIMMGGKPTIIPAAEGTTPGGKSFPSVVAITKDGLLVGEPARRQAIANPANTVIAAKREMGTDHSFNMSGKKFKPEQISAFILKKIKKDAEAYIGEPVEKAIITVPAYFNDNQRRATKSAGMIAGFDVMRIINEPTAAALAYGINKAKNDIKILVFDFGGGTLDVTIMDMGSGVFEVMSTSGNTQLGGEDMDRAIVNYIVSEFRKNENIDLFSDNAAMSRIKEAAEKAKIELSSTMEAVVNLPFISHSSEYGTKDLKMTLTRAKFEEIVTPIVEKCKTPILNALNDANLEPDNIGKVVMVGGPTRIPLVRKFIGEIIGKTPESGIDPMEAVATGAAIQAGKLNGDASTDIVLLDVTPLSLGVDIEGGIMSTIIKRNTAIPISATRPYTTIVDNQDFIKFNVLQGERPMAEDNLQIGQFTITDIIPAPKGTPEILVKFDMDTSGVLDVTAEDKATKKKVKIKIKSTKIPDKEIERLKNEAEKFFGEDNVRKEKVEFQKDVKQYIYEIRRRLANADITPIQKTEIINSINDAESSITSELTILRSKFDKLKSTADRIIDK